VLNLAEKLDVLGRISAKICGDATLALMPIDGRNVEREFGRKYECKMMQMIQPQDLFT
jgi:hypothetical protein